MKAPHPTSAGMQMITPLTPITEVARVHIRPTCPSAKGREGRPHNSSPVLIVVPSGNYPDARKEGGGKTRSVCLPGVQVEASSPIATTQRRPPHLIFISPPEHDKRLRHVSKWRRSGPTASPLSPRQQLAPLAAATVAAILSFHLLSTPAPDHRLCAPFIFVFFFVCFLTV